MKESDCVLRLSLPFPSLKSYTCTKVFCRQSSQKSNLGELGLLWTKDSAAIVDQNFTADIPLLLHPTKIWEVSLGQKTASITGRATKIAEPTTAGSLQKWSVTLADETGAIPVTLWNSKAALNITVGDILVIHDGLLSKFGGLSISVSENTAIHLNSDEGNCVLVTTNKKLKENRTRSAPSCLLAVPTGIATG